MIEAKIFRIKCRMIDFVLRQQDIQTKIDSLNNDINILERKIEETQSEQATAIELEDYDKADTLDMRIKQTKKLIEAKENQIRQMQENNLTQEVVKADKLQELAELMHTSVGRVESIRDKQLTEMSTFETEETLRLEKRKKELHYEHIRITEEKATLEEEKVKVDDEISKIDELVYADTKE